MVRATRLGPRGPRGHIEGGVWLRAVLAFAVAVLCAGEGRAAARASAGETDVGGRAGSASAASADIPEALRPWSRWVLHDHLDELCPVMPDEQDGICLWPGKLTLVLTATGGTFAQDVEVLAPDAVRLPGGVSTWPLDVKVDGKAAVVLAAGDGDDARPVVHLGAGRHKLSGAFAWRELPESLPVPEQTGLVSLKLQGRAVDFPSRATAGELFLRGQQQPLAEEDKLDIAVHRRLDDGVPALLTTRLTLSVSGKAREVVLGRALPVGFVAHALESPLPARVEPDGRLRVQLRAGTWVLSLVARHETPLAKVSRPSPDGPWKDGDEVWVFAADPDLRVVTVEGVATIDPQQTTLPDEWRALPAYLMTADATMTLNQRRRGDQDPPPDQLTLARQLWVDFDGGGLTARDQISGKFARGGRLAMGRESTLGHVSIGGQDQFITRVGPQGTDGVEVRQTQAVVVADSRVARGHDGVPAVGWDQDFQSVSATLALPPGWMLAHASGADGVSSTWLRTWTLLDLFLLLITGIGIGKVFGWRMGALALVTLGLILPQVDAPQWIWLVVLVVEVLVRALPQGRLRTTAALARLGTWVVLLVLALPFAIGEVRVALYPALAREISHVSYYSPPPDRFVGMTGVLKGNADDKDEMRALLGRAGADGEEIGDAYGLPLAGVGSLAPDKKMRRKEGAQAKSAPNFYAEPDPSSALAERQAAQNLTAYDPHVVVQTGPGVPRWDWQRIALVWNGPVERTQRLHLWLVPPVANLLLGLARVALMAALIVGLLRGRRKVNIGPRGDGKTPTPTEGTTATAATTASSTTTPPASPATPTATAATTLGAIVLLAVGLRATPVGAAELPSAELLDKLRDRLMEKPDCAPSCAAYGRLALEATPAQLRLRLEVGAVATSAVPLPGSAQHWIPAEVSLDGKPAPLVRAADGVLWTEVAAGHHQLVVDGPLPSRETVQLPFRMSPRAVSVTAHGWKIEGLSEAGTIDGSLQLSRARDDAPSTAPAPGTAPQNEGLAGASLPPFVLVERTVELGLKWQVQTRVRRQTPPGAAAVLEVPLLPGESVLTGGVHVTKGRAQVNLAAGEDTLSWSSTLAEAPRVTLRAPTDVAWAEVWRVNASPVWHVTFTGIPSMRPDADAATRVPEWRPWPGETLSIAIAKPTGVPGQTLTVDAARVTWSPGIRSTRAQLELSLRSSRGGEHVITLPEGATIDSFSVQGKVQPARLEGRRLTLPIAPGESTVTVVWRQPVGLSTLFRAPTVELGLPSVNVAVSMEVPTDRWVLLVGGPRLGPAVLFWSFLVVLVLAAVGLARLRLTPLGTRQWILLGLGLSQTPPPAAAVVAGVLLAFGWRRGRPPTRRPWLHNLGQLVLALWLMVAVAVLFAAVRQGLLEQPDMRISGNGSYQGHLEWFADRVAGAMPQPFVMSVPLLVYRLVMLAWALWLALAVIRWARWIWACFTEGELWRTRPKTTPARPAPAAAPASPPPPETPPAT